MIALLGIIAMVAIVAIGAYLLLDEHDKRLRALEKREEV